MRSASRLDLLWMLAGFAIWGVALNLLYGTQSLGCEMGWQDQRLGATSILRVLLLLVWLLHLGVHVGLLLAVRQRFGGAAADEPRGHVVALAALVLAIGGFAATFVTGAPVVLATPCAG